MDAKQENGKERISPLDILGYIESAGPIVVLTTLGIGYFLFSSYQNPLEHSQRTEVRYQQPSNKESQPEIYYKFVKIK